MHGALKSTETLIVRLLRRLVDAHRRTKFFLILAIDAVMCIAAVIIGFSLRLGELDLWSPAIATVTAAALVLWLPLFLFRGIYRKVVRYIGSRTMMGIET